MGCGLGREKLDHPARAVQAPGENRPERDALARLWLELTRVTLPGMARRHGWPISRDHCFMRVCLDLSLGGPWRERVAAPAFRHLTDAQFQAAIRVAEAICANPGILPALNQESLRLRGKLPPGQPAPSATSRK